jgi:hypoxanthine phosphoribosyltransferase
MSGSPSKVHMQTEGLKTAEDSKTLAHEKLFFSYNDVHKVWSMERPELTLTKLIQEKFPKIVEFKPDVIIAIGTGGFLPARILRAFFKKMNQITIPLLCIGLNLYEDIHGSGMDNIIGMKVHKTQWLNFKGEGHDVVDLVGKRVLVVDEVDDTRSTLAYAIKELEIDAMECRQRRSLEDNVALDSLPPTVFGVFVVHNKIKPKRASLPEDLMKDRYYAALDIEDRWCCYPWGTLICNG